MRGFLVLLLAVAAHAQPYLNLDFETVTRGRLRGWFFGAPGYELTADRDAVSGNFSMRIRNTGAPDTGIGPTSILLPLDAVKPRHLKVSGWIRTEAVNPGYAAIWLRVDGPAGFITLDNMSATGPRGSTGWTRYEYERQVSPDAIRVVFGTFLQGRGTAWFDNLQVEVDGKPIPQGPEPFVGEPTQEQVSWVRQNA